MLSVRQPVSGRVGTPRRPRLGIMKFASCDGCQLTLLDLEDELLELASTFDIVEFAEASSHRSSGPFDLVLVEGSISTPDQLAEIQHIRRETPLLVTIGACATAGGIQALRNWRDHGSVHRAVYAMPEYVDSLATATPISDHVAVDAELRGCPIDPGQLLELLTALAVGRRPQLPDQAVCVECKRAGTVCVLVARDLPCLGPVTRAGCGAICPAFDRGCYGCFGPREAANLPSLTGRFHDDGRSDAGSAALFSGFTAYAEPFRSAIDRLGGPPTVDEASTGTREASDARA
jgi:coenzyme F420-reducing hydrogenase gamma subunit